MIRFILNRLQFAFLVKWKLFFISLSVWLSRNLPSYLVDVRNILSNPFKCKLITGREFARLMHCFVSKRTSSLYRVLKKKKMYCVASGLRLLCLADAAFRIISSGIIFHYFKSLRCVKFFLLFNYFGKR